MACTSEASLVEVLGATQEDLDALVTLDVGQHVAIVLVELWPVAALDEDFGSLGGWIAAALVQVGDVALAEH